MTEGSAGRIVLVTGATRGIGYACAERLARTGWGVVLTGTNGSAAEAAARRLQASTSSEVSGLELDQTDSKSIAALVKSIHGSHGRLDGLVANAGIHRAGRLGMIDETSIDEVLSTNVGGPLRLVQSCVRLLRRSTRPSVVLMGSIMATEGTPGQSVYAMSKAAIHGFVTPAARELAGIGCRVNAVAPGYVETDMSASMTESERQSIVAATPLRRMAAPEEVAAVVAFLLGDDSSFVTGQVLGVDGGLRL